MDYIPYIIGLVCPCARSAKTPKTARYHRWVRFVDGIRFELTTIILVVRQYIIDELLVFFHHIVFPSRLFF